jgi:membrane protein DedA with SNARE-associated domain/rhodanese-related sulfurtransferase
MESLLSGLSDHGYSILFIVVFLEAIGIPVPAAIALLIAGGASARHSLHPGLALASAFTAMIVADTWMFLLGRYTGWWLLGLLCRLSLNPESCILRSADSFYRRGRTLLLFAKFVPGINTMAPPLAGSMNMRLSQFLRLDLLGVLIYIGSYFTVGYLFSDVLGAVLKGYRTFGQVLGWILGIAVVAYVAFQVWMWRKSRSRRFRRYVQPAEAYRAWSAGSAVLYDVRSHGYYDRKAMRIQGSKRLEPNAIHQSTEEFPPGKHIYLYCTCVREATSARVAQELREKGVISAVIEGGLRGWKKAGLPLEPVPEDEVSALPVFDL